MREVSTQERIDRAEELIVRSGGDIAKKGGSVASCPVVHRFTPGLYIREIFMPAGAVLTSKIHKKEHPFVVSMGVVCVYSDNEGPVIIAAPYTGITKPGTRRFLVVVEDTIWTTFHTTDLQNVEDIEDEIMESHENPLIAQLEIGGGE